MGLVVGWLLLHDRARVPADPPSPSPPIEANETSAPGPKPPTPRENKVVSRVPILQPTQDPAQIAVADYALANMQTLFLDSSALESVNAGDIRGGILPRELSNRKIALAAIETLLAQPENTGQIRTRSLQVLESLLREPWPPLKTPEADQFVLAERARALTILIAANPDAAATAYRAMPDREVQERVSKRAAHLLVLNGMGKEDAEAKLSKLTGH